MFAKSGSGGKERSYSHGLPVSFPGYSRIQALSGANSDRVHTERTCIAHNSARQHGTQSGKAENKHQVLDCDSWDNMQTESCPIYRWPVLALIDCH